MRGWMKLKFTSHWKQIFPRLFYLRALMRKADDACTCNLSIKNSISFLFSKRAYKSSYTSITNGDKKDQIQVTRCIFIIQSRDNIFRRQKVLFSRDKFQLTIFFNTNKNVNRLSIERNIYFLSSFENLSSNKLFRILLYVNFFRDIEDISGFGDCGASKWSRKRLLLLTSNVGKRESE